MSLVELQNEVQEVFDIDVSLPTILRSLQREGYTMKTVRFYHLNQSVGLITTMLGVAFCSWVKWARLWGVLSAHHTHFRPEQLVFADESHFNRLTLRRPYVWSIWGTCARWYEFFMHGTKYTILLALSLDNILHLEVCYETMCGLLLYGYDSC